MNDTRCTGTKASSLFGNCVRNTGREGQWLKFVRTAIMPQDIPRVIRPFLIASRSKGSDEGTSREGKRKKGFKSLPFVVSLQPRGSNQQQHKHTLSAVTGDWTDHPETCLNKQLGILGKIIPMVTLTSCLDDQMHPFSSSPYPVIRGLDPTDQKQTEKAHSRK